MKKRTMAEPAVFLAILLVVISIMNIIITPDFMQKHNLYFGRNRIYMQLAKEKKDSIDVLVIGDSESYTSFSPMSFWKEYGITSFAAGQAGAKIGETYDLLKFAFKRQKPKVVLMETNNLFRFSGGSKPMDNDSGKLAGAIYKRIPFIKNHSMWKLAVDPGKRRKVYKGYNVSAKVRPYDGRITNDKVVTGNEITRSGVRSFEKIRRLCAENGAELVMYSAPSPRCYNGKKTAFLTRFAAKRNIPYVDLNSRVKDMNISWETDTRDHGDHLNASGAMKTTAYLGRWIMDNVDLEYSADIHTERLWDREYLTYAKAEDRALKKIDKTDLKYRMSIETKGAENGSHDDNT